MKRIVSSERRSTRSKTRSSSRRTALSRRWIVCTRTYSARGTTRMALRREATIEDLYHVPENGKAEIVNGELVLMSPTGARPGRAAGAIFVSLSVYEEQHGSGFAFGDNVG